MPDQGTPAGRPVGDADDDASTAHRRLRLLLAYDGAAFHGFAEQHGVRTVMGVLREACERVLRHPVELVGAGRTDAGVHAWGQVVSGDIDAGVDLPALARRLNRLCGPEIAVREAAWAEDPVFNARFSAVWRHYRYDVLNTPVPNPFLAARTWQVVQPLELAAMRLGCDPLIGEHDFSSFCRRPKVAAGDAPATMRRRVLSASWRAIEHDQVGTDGRLLRFEIRANAFCHQMVRSIVGTLVDVGLGRLHAGEVRGIMLAAERTGAGHVAPPHGLTLWEVGYG